MKLEVTKWIMDFIVTLFRQSIEGILRITLFFLPLGLYLMLLEFRSKVSSVSNLTVYTNDKSVWQYIFPGFILVAIDPNFFKSELKKKKESFQNWIKQNQYMLAFLVMFVIVLLMFLN